MRVFGQPHIFGTPLGQSAAAGGAAAPAAIYGVSWDKSSTPTLTRTDDAVGMTAAAGVDMTPASNDFDSAEIYSEITEVTDALGNVFVRIPRFYIRKTDGVGFKTWQVSKTSHGAGWYLPACFYDFDTGAALPYVDVGKYNASLSGDNKLESKVDKYPLVGKNIVEFRGYAQANGAGYQQLDIHVVDALQTLFYVEFATLNSQAIMAGFTSGQNNAAHTATVAENGVNRIIVANATAALYEVGQAISVGTTLGGNQIFYGRTITGKAAYDGSNTAISFDGATVNIAVSNILYNTGWKSGFSSGIAASSGSLVSNSTGRYPMQYRGIENLYGSVFQLVDGVNINDRQAWVCENADEYVSNLFAAPYEQLGYVNHNANGYVLAMGFDADRPFAAFPAAAGGDQTTYYSDQYIQSAGQRIAALGGGWYYGVVAGLTYWNLNDAASVSYLSLGGRLIRKGAA